MNRAQSQNRWLKRIRVGLLGAVVCTLIVGMGSVAGQRSPFLWPTISTAQAQPAQLRRVNPSAIATLVYEQLPTLPIENQYISSKTGKVAADNTLVSRIIRYHLYSKERPTNLRLDWKLTMADYLGAFDRISANNYASFGLQENPAEADVAIVQGLSPEDRNLLVNALYTSFTTAAEAESATR